MLGLRDDGTSASPMPAELAEMNFCERFGWTWWDYYNTPRDVIHRWTYIAGKVDPALAERRKNSTPDGGETTYMKDDD